jgi:hypothetical protein
MREQGLTPGANSSVRLFDCTYVSMLLCLFEAAKNDAANSKDKGGMIT